jgi:hypothetical protein
VAEFLVRDADSSQQAAIEAALAGRNLVIDGPPGTGKSQTIANLIELSGGALTSAWRDLDAMLATARLQRPEKYADWEAFLSFLAGVSASVTRMGPEVFGPGLRDLVWATGDAAWRRAHPQSLGLWARWRLVRRARPMPVSGRVDRRTAPAAPLTAADQQARWSHYSIDDSGPSAVPRLAETITALSCRVTARMNWPVQARPAR